MSSSTRILSSAALSVALAGAIVFVAPAAHASCAPDPAALSYRQMIVRRTTGVDGYPIMFLGAVVTTKDVAGRRGGPTIAKIAVASHPVGFAPLVSRVRFWRDYPGVGSEDLMTFRSGRRYVVIARKRADGTFSFDGGYSACGQTQQIGKWRFHALVRLSEES